ncbi:pentatricopeptide repeat-containing protein At1g15510, chloroplastic-like [Syzygium oleosum]|uniref:pentatricopeptide repeat-containing protein At1g15510, chloroplastic-like n=1 Tax=Syzygium oleosum TaxID=219896 RepID=UPI0024B93138|nr:pentatricopeptide repeat-containing protein At1g15510, chloroplastic-like [Syzygium oleosum]
MNPSISLCLSGSFLVAPPTKSVDLRGSSRPSRSSSCEEGRPFSFNRVLDSLSSCAALSDLKSGSCVHAATVKRGFDADVIVGNTLLNFHSKCGCVVDAAKVFECMPERTVVSWTSMMSAFCEVGESDKVVSMYGQMLQEVDPNEFSLSVLLKACARRADPRLVESVHCCVVKEGRVMDGFLSNALVGAYAKSGYRLVAEKLIGDSEGRDVVSWTSLISRAVEEGEAEMAMSYFFRMQEDGIAPNEITILSVLRACSLINELLVFQWVQGLIMKVGWCLDDFVLNSLLEMYLVKGYFFEGMQIFCKYMFLGEDRYLQPETLAVILQGCCRVGFLELGKQMHCYLIKKRAFPSLVVENSLINLYAENGRAHSAFELFKRMSVKDIVSWNCIISCLARYGNYSDALLQFKKIHCNEGNEPSSPDFVTALAILQACSEMSSSQLGQMFHGYITKTGLVCDIFLQNSLIDMYGRTGRLDLAKSIFQDMQIKDLPSYNSLITALGINGDGLSALRAFDKLKELETIQPNGVTFTNVLSACAHAGMVEEGLGIFYSMKREYGIEPSMEHFACVVDLLARSGKLEEALTFIRAMPTAPGPAVWGALLGACAIHNRIDVAEESAKWLSLLDQKGKAWRVGLSNVYASAGRWEDSWKVRAELERLDGKEVAWSSVAVQGEDVKFMVNDTKHPQSRSIYEVLATLTNHIKL